MQSKERLGKIIADLADEDLWERKKRLEMYDNDGEDVSLLMAKRKGPLDSERIDLKACAIFEEVKDEVNTLNEVTTRTTLQHFFRSYADLRIKQEEMSSQDRETVLLDLKRELERIGKESVVVSEQGFMDDACAAFVEEGSNIIITKAGLETTTVTTKSVQATLSRFEGLKAINERMKRAKNHIESLYACLEFRRMKTEAKRVEILEQSNTISESLISIKRTLHSVRKNKEEVERIMTNRKLKKKVAEAKAIYDSWKRQEVILSNLNMHRKRTLKHLQLDMQSHRGKLQKSEIESKKSILKTKLREQSASHLHRLKSLRGKVNGLISEMAQNATRYQKTISHNINHLEKVNKIFGKLESAIRKSSNCWSMARAVSSHITLTTHDAELERRLQDTAMQVSIEKRVIANDLRFTRFFAKDDSFDAPRVKLISASKPEEAGVELFTSLANLGPLLDVLTTVAKRTFTTLNAVKTLDSCLGFSCSKLDVLFYDVIHTQTYLKARNAALSLSLATSAEPKRRRTEDHNKITQKKTISAEDQTKILKGKTRSAENQHTVLPTKILNIRPSPIPIGRQDMFWSKKLRRRFGNSYKGEGVLRPKLATMPSVFSTLKPTAFRGATLNRPLRAPKQPAFATKRRSSQLFKLEKDDEEKKEQGKKLQEEDSTYPIKNPNSFLADLKNGEDNGVTYTLPWGNDTWDARKEHIHWLQEQHKMIITLQVEENLRREEKRHELNANDMARHFWLHPGDDFFHRGRPVRFLFYTKGIGVFEDSRGRMVDAFGLPFPRQRDCPGNPDELASMTHKAINPLKQSIPIYSKLLRNRLAQLL